MAKSTQVADATASSSICQQFPIVGVGASAGGLDALRRLLGAVPKDPKFAIVIVHHLARDKPTFAPELLAKCTDMPVRQADDGTLVEPGHVYIIPPGQFLSIDQGRLTLTTIEGPRTAPIAIDCFFRALAKSQQECAVGIILSGTGSDGTLGIKAIKEAGGLVLVQDLSTAEFSGMAESAIATGIVDKVLRPEAMAESLSRFAEHDYMRNGKVTGELTPEHVDVADPEENSQQSITRDEASGNSATEDASNEGLAEIIAILNAEAKRDFRSYKLATLVRRTRRRMCLHYIEQFDEYREFLKKNPDEVQALAKDLLISVTVFFRDREVWEKLADKVIPQIVAAKSADDVVRVWCAGCATGEEVYTVAILVLEEISKQRKLCGVQIFASDIDTNALEHARAGIYPISIQADVSPERLERFFVLRDGGSRYQVKKSLREMVVFANQNLISDPPFSQLDLICCRNLLIYLKAEMQQEIISLFYFALRRSGVLLLGKAETIGRSREPFETIDKAARIFQNIGRAHDNNAVLPSARVRQQHRFEILARASRQKKPAEIAQQALLTIIAPSAVMIDRQWRILYISGNVNAYLTHQEGVPNDDLLRKIVPTLRSQLRSAVDRSYADKTVTSVTAMANGPSGIREVCINVELISSEQNGEDFALIRFEDVKKPSSVENGRTPTIPNDVSEESEPNLTPSDERSYIVQLEEELTATRDDLQSTIEQFEIASEECMTSSEEVMSINEEFQSTNEELETSKEELHSLNEDLSAVNLQLLDKVNELEVKHADLENLIAATEVATICLGTDLAIRWFTPAARELIRFKPADVGRPLSDLQNDFLLEGLFQECERVLRTLRPIDSEVDCTGDRVFFRRIVPYHTVDHQIGGIVITLLDITPLRKRENELRTSKSELRELNKTLEEKVVQRTELMSILQYATKVANEAKSVKEGMLAAMANLAEHNGWRVGHVWKLANENVYRSDRLRDSTGANEATSSGVSVSIRSNVSFAPATWRSARIWHVDEEYRQESPGLKEFQRVTEQMTVGTDDEIVGVVIQSGRPQEIRDISDLRNTPRATIAGLNLHGAVAFPITIDAEVVAIMTFFSEKPQKSDPAFLAIMVDVGIQLGHLIQRKRLEQVVASIANEEEKRIGRELHDGIAQQLTGGALIAESLRKLLPEQMTAQRDCIGHLIEIIRDTQEDVSLLSRGLMPDAISADDLLPALRGLVIETKKRSDIDVTLNTEGFDESFVRADLSAATIYQIARESLHNAHKHSGSDVIDVTISTSKNFQLVVQDHGDGFDLHKFKPKSNGIRIMRYRAEAIGGQLTMESKEREGTRVVLTIPQARCQS